MIKVYYVYTQYRESETFSQPVLDRSRMNQLYRVYPFLIDDVLIEWEIIEQTGCKITEDGDSYFHGFVLYHRPVESEESRAAELNWMHNFLADTKKETYYDMYQDPVASQLGSDTIELKTELKTQPASFVGGDNELFSHFRQSLKNSPEISPARDDVWVTIQITVNENGQIENLTFIGEYSTSAKNKVENAFKEMPLWQPALENGKKVSSVVNLEIRVSYSIEVNGMYTRDGKRPEFKDDQIDMPEGITGTDINLLQTGEPFSVKNTAPYKGLDLLKNKKNLAMIMDVTGSMYTHIAGMISWMQTYSINHPFTSFTFFNDGDKKTTKQKRIGGAGGIYFTKSAGELNEKIDEAMLKGNGGEAPENDIEALLYAIQHDEQAEELVLIADNFSEVRDMELLNHVTKPVHVILCAAPKFVRPEYLKIAKDTGGLFIVNGEITDLSNVKNGDIVLIQKVKYHYKNNQFEIDHKGDIHY
ncbi:MAG: hypothetical protein IPH66_07325 [Crocinitomicaceae bacterium]|nr:hypothetical protein [Crocinitomicaceae bacterium]